MSENNLTGISGKLAESTTNTRRSSLVEGLVDPYPLVLYRPETSDFFIVPPQSVAAFENECRLLDQVMQTFQEAKEQHLQMKEALFDTQRLAEAHDRSIPQSPQVLRDAQRKVEASEQNLIVAQRKVEAEFKPLERLDGTNGKLYELIPIMQRSTPLSPTRDAGANGPRARSQTDQRNYSWGRKWTYVRSEKVANHYRSYNLNAGEQAKHQGAASKSVITPDGKIDMDKLRQQLTTLETSVNWRKEAGGGDVFLKDLNSSIKETLEGWANGINEGSNYIDLGVEAQLARYFAGAGMATSWNPRRGNVAVRADARAEFMIAEGKFRAAAYWPGRGGHMISMKGPSSGKDHKIGLVRLAAELDVFGLVGASICGQLGLEVDYSGVGRANAGVRGRPSSRPISSRGLELGGQIRDGAHFGGAADIFAGARAGGSVKGALEWNSPESKKFESLCKIGPGVQGQAGIGIAGEFRIDFVDGRFRVLASAAACFGFGAGGKLELVVDAGRTFEFVKYMAYALYSVGYEFFEIISNDAFKAWKDFSLWAILNGRDIEDAIARFGYAIRDSLHAVIGELEKEAGRIALMERVLSNPELLEYAPPETKGIILYQLTRHSLLTKSLPQNRDILSPDTLGRRKRAVLTVCKKARSRSEFRNICQHMTIDGSSDPKGWQENYLSLQRFLDQLIDTRNMDQQLRDFESGLARMYDQLYDTPVLGYAFIDNDNPRYCAQALQGTHDGYLVAGGYDPGPVMPEFGSENSSAKPQYA